MTTITKIRLTVGLTFIIAAGAGALWLLVPPPEGVEPDAFYSAFGTPVTLIDTVVAISSAVLFFAALRNFKKELKPAYQFVAYAQLVVGAGSLLFPYIEYYNLWDNIWLNMSTYLAYFFGGFMMYLGARKFYILLGRTSRLTSLWIPALATVVLWGLHSFVPHADSWGPFGLKEWQYDLFELIPLAPLIWYGAALYLTVRVLGHIGAEYQRAFRWLATGIGFQLIAVGGVCVMEVIGYENWYYASRAYFTPVILGDACLLIAAYQFKAIGLPRGQGLMARLGHRQAKAVTSFDIISYAVGMADDPSKVEESIEQVRMISSRITPAEATNLNAADQQQLRDAYLGIESYLVSKDHLRSFTVPGVRSAIDKRFNLSSNGANTFWPLLG